MLRKLLVALFLVVQVVAVAGVYTNIVPLPCKSCKL